MASIRARLGNWWWDLPLRRKAMLIILVPVLTIAAPAIYVVVLIGQQSDVRRDSRAASDLQVEVVALADDLSRANAALAQYSQDLEVDLAAVNEFVVAYEVLRAELVDASDAGELVEPVADLVRAGDALVDEVDDVGAPSVATVDDRLAEWTATSTDMEVAIDDTVDALAARTEQLRGDVDAMSTRIVVALLAGLAASFVTGLVALLLFVRSILGRVQVLNAATDRVIAGQPIGAFDAPARDEIGLLASHLARAAQMLIDANTEAAGARDAAVAATTAKDEFLSRMSHELRTPLTAILGFGQLLQLEERLEGQDRDAVDQIVKAGQHLLQLINELLDISRIATGNLALSLEAVEVADVATTVVDLLRPQARQREITVSATVPDGLLVLADHQRLRQVLLNLVSNAIKYNSDGGLVAVRAEAADDIVRMSVTDTGPGISDSDRERLFTPFERLSAPSTVEGTGVGLALSKSLVEAMRGTIGVDSSVGVGTTFWVELPAIALERAEPALAADARSDDGSVARPEPTTAGAVRPVGPDDRVVLYIEDNVANTRVVERVVRQRGERLEIAMQGGLGIELARTLGPDVILLDIHLPDMNGADVLRALKAAPDTAAIPVVVLSADATSGGERRLRDLGAIACLTKPIDLPALSAVLDDCAAAVP